MQRLLLILPILFMVSCGSNSRTETPKETEERSVVNELPEQKEEYRKPDGGFGALDHSRDVREEAEQQQQTSEDALKDTN